MSEHTKKKSASLYCIVSIINQVEIQPKLYLVLGQIKQKYLAETANLLNLQVLTSTVIASLLTHINVVM